MKKRKRIAVLAADIANDYMFPSECRGVIFYLSENSILSDAVIDEIKYAKKLKKAVIIIMLPFLNDYSYKGESTLNKYYSAHQVAVILKENGQDIDGSPRTIETDAATARS